MKTNNKAFTLIELLVVVLIIGILVAIAVPMYENAIAKTRATQLLTAARQIADAESRFYLESNEYTEDPTMLDIAYQLNSAQTQFEFKFGTCDFAYVKDTTPRTSCTLTTPHLTLHQYIGKPRLNCMSHSDDNYKGDFVCQELTEEETPYKSANNMHYFSAGIISE